MSRSNHAEQLLRGVRHALCVDMKEVCGPFEPVGGQATVTSDPARFTWSCRLSPAPPGPRFRMDLFRLYQSIVAVLAVWLIYIYGHEVSPGGLAFLLLILAGIVAPFIAVLKLLSDLGPVRRMLRRMQPSSRPNLEVDAQLVLTPSEILLRVGDQEASRPCQLGRLIRPYADREVDEELLEEPLDCVVVGQTVDGCLFILLAHPDAALVDPFVEGLATALKLPVAREVVTRFNYRDFAPSLS